MVLLIVASGLIATGVELVYLIPASDSAVSSHLCDVEKYCNNLLKELNVYQTYSNVM